MRGRKNTATALKLLNGNPGHGRLNRREPKPRLLTPVAPEGLGKRAQAKWEELVHVMLAAPGWLTEADGPMLDEAARAYARWIQLEEEVDQFGPIFESVTHITEDGQIVEASDPRARFARMSRKANPALIGINRERAAYHKAVIELGMSPTQRARLVIRQDDNENDDLDSY